MKTPHMYINIKKSEQILRRLLKETEESHIDVIKAQIKVFSIMMSFILNQDDSTRDFSKHLKDFNENYQACFGFCYQLSEDFQKEIIKLEYEEEDINASA